MIVWHSSAPGFFHTRCGQRRSRGSFVVCIRHLEKVAVDLICMLPELEASSCGAGVSGGDSTAKYHRGRDVDVARYRRNETVGRRNGGLCAHEARSSFRRRSPSHSPHTTFSLCCPAGSSGLPGLPSKAMRHALRCPAELITHLLQPPSSCIPQIKCCHPIQTPFHTNSRPSSPIPKTPGHPTSLLLFPLQHSHHPSFVLPAPILLALPRPPSRVP